MKLGAYLIRERVTQETFARRIGCAATSVSRYVNGVRRPSRAIMRAIMRETKGKVTADDFECDDKDQEYRPAA